jgi:hypothetical protein
VSSSSVKSRNCRFRSCERGGWVGGGVGVRKPQEAKSRDNESAHRCERNKRDRRGESE